MTNEKELNRPPTYDELLHWGISGMKWGRRRWQNPDGSLTPAGYVHYGINPKTGEAGYFRTKYNKDYHDSPGNVSSEYESIDRIFSDTTWDNTWNRPDSRQIQSGKDSVDKLLGSKEGRKELEKMAKKMPNKEKKKIKKEANKLEKERNQQAKDTNEQRQNEPVDKKQDKNKNSQPNNNVKLNQQNKGPSHLQDSNKAAKTAKFYGDSATNAEKTINMGKNAIFDLSDSMTSTRYNTRALEDLSTKYKTKPPKTLEEAYDRVSMENKYLDAMQTRAKYDKGNRRFKTGVQATATAAIVGVGVYSTYKILQNMAN